MKLETVKKDKRKKIIIGSMIVLSVVGCLTFTVTRAKYRSIQSLKLASGIVNYKASDLHIVAVKVSEDGENYINSSEIPEGSYALNTEKSKCRTSDPTLTGENAPVDESITIEYVDGKLNFKGLTKNNTKCYVYFDKFESPITILDIIASIEARTDNSYKKGTVPTFTSVATGAETEDNNGIYVTDDPMYGENVKTYYWRGAATTNHVIFASKCWRIVRINGDKTIRLIYNGRVLENNTCMGNGENPNSSALVGIQYNNILKMETVGWTYILGTQRTLEGTSSNAKTEVEKWYSENIGISSEYDNAVSQGKFCNDRRTQSEYFTSNNDWNADSSGTNYSPYSRVRNSVTLTCNNLDTYNTKVGLITSDEVKYAGGLLDSVNKSFYLYNGSNYWTMSPYWGNSMGATMMRVTLEGKIDGDLSNSYVNRTYNDIRPVINLKADTLFNAGSNGTQNNPYIVQ